ncbi:MAG: hypothetical protein AB1651_00210 [Pseudomonadota bacterium]
MKIKKHLSVVCAACIAVMQGYTTVAFADDRVLPMLGVQASWGRAHARTRVDFGMGVHLQPGPEASAAIGVSPSSMTRLAGRTAYIPLLSASWHVAGPQSGGVRPELAAARQAGEKESSRGPSLIGPVMIVGGLTAIVLIAKNRWDDQSSGSGSGE